MINVCACIRKICVFENVFQTHGLHCFEIPSIITLELILINKLFYKLFSKHTLFDTLVSLTLFDVSKMYVKDRTFKMRY